MKDKKKWLLKTNLMRAEESFYLFENCAARTLHAFSFTREFLFPAYDGTGRQLKYTITNLPERLIHYLSIGTDGSKFPFFFVQYPPEIFICNPWHMSF